MNNPGSHVIAMPSVRIEVDSEEVETWIDQDFHEELDQYVSDLEVTEDESYDARAWTAGGDRATINYVLEEYDNGTDLQLEISGGKMAVDTVQNGFKELWTGSDLGYDQ